MINLDNRKHKRTMFYRIYYLINILAFNKLVNLNLPKQCT